VHTGPHVGLDPGYVREATEDGKASRILTKLDTSEIIGVWMRIPNVLESEFFSKGNDSVRWFTVGLPGEFRTK
jgi:hypothetical protein